LLVLVDAVQRGNRGKAVVLDARITPGYVPLEGGGK
jgi:hypothetical protein